MEKIRIRGTEIQQDVEEFTYLGTEVRTNEALTRISKNESKKKAQEAFVMLKPMTPGISIKRQSKDVHQQRKIGLSLWIRDLETWR